MKKALILAASLIAAGFVMSGCDSGAKASGSTTLTNGDVTSVGSPATAFAESSGSIALKAAAQSPAAGAIFVSDAKGNFPPEPPMQ